MSNIIYDKLSVDSRVSADIRAANFKMNTAGGRHVTISQTIEVMVRAWKEATARADWPGLGSHDNGGE